MTEHDSSETPAASAESVPSPPADDAATADAVAAPTAGAATEAPQAPPSAAPPPPQAPPQAAAPASPPAAAALPATGGGLLYPRRPLLAAFLSAVVPGMGNVYNGLYSRGAIFFLLILGLLNLGDREPGIFAPMVIFLWIFNIFDAYRQAVFLSHGGASAIDRTPTQVASRGERLALGLGLVIVGFLGMLAVYTSIDLSRIFDLWPLFMLAAGLWVLWRAVASKDD